MYRRLYREFYLLPRGEQRALILLSLLLILSLLFRITVQLLPDREAEGMEEFELEASLIMASFAEADSLQQVRNDSIRQQDSARQNESVRWTQNQAYTHTRKTGKPILPININRADSTQLLPLTGIGPVYAGRIIKYRSLLGGFVSVEQLGEVYGMPVETLNLIKNLISIDTTAIRKIPLNSATFRELLKHPYLEYEDVKAIVNYRDFAGDIKSIHELRINQILHDSTLNMIGGYFDYR